MVVFDTLLALFPDQHDQNGYRHAGFGLACQVAEPRVVESMTRNAPALAPLDHEESTTFEQTRCADDER
jgi:hypothetical protein